MCKMCIRDRGSADLSVDIADFTQLVLGVMGLEEIAYRDTVQIQGNREILSKVFVEKDVYLSLIHIFPEPLGSALHMYPEGVPAFWKTPAHWV